MILQLNLFLFGLFDLLLFILFRFWDFDVLYLSFRFFLIFLLCFSLNYQLLLFVLLLLFSLFFFFIYFIIFFLFLIGLLFLFFTIWYFCFLLIVILQFLTPWTILAIFANFFSFRGIFRIFLYPTIIFDNGPLDNITKFKMLLNFPVNLMLIFKLYRMLLKLFVCWFLFTLWGVLRGRGHR